MKQKSLVAMIFLLMCSVSTYAKKYAFIEVGHSNINTSIVDVLDVNAKTFTHPIEFFQLPISAGKSLSRDAKSLSSTVIAEINETLLEIIDLAKSKGVNELDVLVFFSSSYDYLVEEEKTRIIGKVKTETTLIAEFCDSYTEGKAITETALRELGESATVVYIGSSTTKGGTVDRNPQTNKQTTISII